MAKKVWWEWLLIINIILLIWIEKKLTNLYTCPPLSFDIRCVCVLLLFSQLLFYVSRFLFHLFWLFQNLWEMLEDFSSFTIILQTVRVYILHFLWLLKKLQEKNTYSSHPSFQLFLSLDHMSKEYSHSCYFNNISCSFALYESLSFVEHDRGDDCPEIVSIREFTFDVIMKVLNYSLVSFTYLQTIFTDSSLYLWNGKSWTWYCQSAYKYLRLVLKMKSHSFLLLAWQHISQMVCSAFMTWWEEEVHLPNLSYQFPTIHSEKILMIILGEEKSLQLFRFH